MDEFKYAKSSLEDIDRALDDICSSVVKISTALEAHPDTDYTSEKFEAPDCELTDEEAGKFFYTHIAVDSLFLSQGLNNYYEKLDSFERWYQSNAENIDSSAKEQISGWQRDMEKRMQEIRPEISDISDELEHFGLEVYTTEPSASPVNSRVASD